MVIGLEATEALRSLSLYGNPRVKVICNTRPIHPASVISGERRYPAAKDIREWMEALSERCWFVNATDDAMRMGSPVYANVIMAGALSGLGELPLERNVFEGVVTETMGPDKLEINLKAFDLGRSMVS